MSRSSVVRRTVVILACALGACAGQSPAVAEPAAPTAPRVSAKPAAAPLAAVGANNAERVKKQWEAAAGGWGRAVAIHRQLGRVAYSNGSEVLIFALRDGKRLPAVAGACPEVIRGGLSYANDRLVIVCEKAAKLVERGGKVLDFPVAASRITAAAFTDTHIALGHHDGVVRIYSVEGGAPAEIPVPGPPIDVKSLALTRDGKRIAIAWVQGSVWWWETSAPEEPHRLVRHENESDTVAFDNDGKLFAEEGETFMTTVWSFPEDGSSDSPLAQHKVKNGSWVKRLHFTRDAQWLIRGGSDGLELAEIAGPRRVALDTRGAVEDVAVDDRGAQIAAVDRDGRLTVWSAR